MSVSGDHFHDAMADAYDDGRESAFKQALELVDFVRCSSGPTDPGNDVWREACDSLEALLKSILAKVRAPKESADE